MIVHDIQEMVGASLASLEAIQIQAFVVHALARPGKICALMGVHQSTPRRWTDAEVALIQDVVERRWSLIEQRVAEGRIRESEALLRIASQAARALSDNESVGIGARHSAARRAPRTGATRFLQLKAAGCACLFTATRALRRRSRSAPRAGRGGRVVVGRPVLQRFVRLAWVGAGLRVLSRRYRAQATSMTGCVHPR
jgi:GAF domain-containing protein